MMRLRRAVLLAAMLVASAANAAELKVLADGPLETSLKPIGAAFSAESGHKVAFVFAPSPVLHKRLADGETGDVLVIQPNFIAELTQAGKVVAGEYPVIARVGIGLAARSGATLKAFISVDEFKQTLLAADTLVFNTLPSGNHFAQVLDRLGIAAAVRDKVVRPNPPEVFARVLNGAGNDIAVGTVPQIKAAPGLTLLGALPGDLQNYLVFAAAPMTGTRESAAAKAFVDFLGTPRAKALFAAAGVE
jgi:molybdate transport system substrate-binding protein